MTSLNTHLGGCINFNIVLKINLTKERKQIGNRVMEQLFDIDAVVSAN